MKGFLARAREVLKIAIPASPEEVRRSCIAFFSLIYLMLAFVFEVTVFPWLLTHNPILALLKMGLIVGLCVALATATVNKLASSRAKSGQDRSDR